MNKYKIICTFFSALILSAAAPLPVCAWETLKNNSGINVSAQRIEGSGVREFMAVTVAEATLSSILALLDDTDNYTRWNYRCSEARLLYKKNDYERITYMVTASPWPVAERDIAVKSIVLQDRETGVVTVSLKGLPGYLPEKEGRVRMTSLRGYWRLEPLGSGRVRIIYRLHSEPGGSVPDSIMNSSLVDIPYNTLWNLRNSVKMEPYKGAR